MTRPLTPDEILAALRRFGITFHEIPGWRDRANGSGWGDVVGFMWHHTGDDAVDDVDLRIVRDGRTGLPGPLCHFGLRDDGTVDLVAAGAANHAGGGDPLVLSAVSKETYAQYPPAPRFTHGEAGSVSGNPRFYGAEAYYSGTHAPTDLAAATMPVLAAAIIDALDRVDTANAWTARSAIGHKEWQRGKVDPGRVDCHTLRVQTHALLTKETDMALDNADADVFVKRLFGTEVAPGLVVKTVLQRLAAVAPATVDVDALAAAIVAALPVGGPTVTAADIAEAVITRITNGPGA